MRKTALLMMAMAAISALAETCHWTGAGGDGYWTNSANWAGNRIPGRWLVADAEQRGGAATNGVTGEVAIFGDDLVAGGATTIDFDGVHSISNLITTGTAHRYTYGASGTQYVPIEPWGRLTVAELANTPVACMPAKFRAGVDCRNGSYDPVTGKWTNWYGEETVSLRNNSATEEFVLENTWGHVTLHPFHSTGGGQTGFRVEGTGDIRIVGAFEGSRPFFYDTLTTGKLVIDGKFAFRSFEIRAPGADFPDDATRVRQIEITENGALGSNEGQQSLLTVARPARIFGDGYLAFTAGWVSSSYWGNGGIYASYDITIECCTKFRLSSVLTAASTAALASYPYRVVVSGGTGAVRLLGPTTIGQEIVKSDWTTMEDPASAFALRQGNVNVRTLFANSFADDGSYGPGAFELSAGSSLICEGTEASSITRTLVLTNVAAGAAAGRLRPQGAGLWTISSPVVTAPNASASTLYLAGSSSAVFEGTVDSKVTVALESGKWTWAPNDGICRKLSVTGGELHLTGTTPVIGEITATASGAALFVPPGCSLSVGKLVTAANKTVDFVLLGDTSQVTIDPSAANVLTGLRVNGHEAVLDAEGHPKMIVGLANVWNVAVDGDWTDPAKWAGGTAVDPLKETYLDARGRSHTVTLNGVASTITNLYVGNAREEAVKLVVTNGAQLTVMGRTHAQAILTLRKGARIEVTDGSELKLFNRGNAVGASGLVSMLKLNGGAISVSGSGRLTDYGIPKSMRTDGLNNNLNGFLTFGSGTVDFRDDAEFTTDYETSNTVQYHYLLPDAAGQTVRVTFHDRAHFNLKNYPWNLIVYGNGGRATLECDTAYEGDNQNLYAQIFLGYGSRGVGEWLMKRGSYKAGYNYVHIGAVGTSDKTTDGVGCITGRLEVAAAASCYMYAYENSSGGFGGVVVGQGLPITKPRGQAYVHGEMLVAGVFEQVRGSFIVGGGPCGDGEVVQSGGTVQIANDAAQSTYSPLGAVLVGGFGGNGRYMQTDGLFATRRTVYVGGATTNEMYHYHNNGNRLQQHHDAQGLVRVQGGSFTTLADIVLGRDGTGVLELSGTGTVAAASLVVSNTTGQAASTLRFTADAKGRCGKIDAATQVRFYPGSKLVVDVTACPEARRQVVALDLDSAVEGAEDVQVELVGDESCRYPHRLAWSADHRRLAYSVDHGLMMYIR